jgi:transcriptional regulator with XRE-family HTH domain
MTYWNHIGDMVRKHREAQGLSQQELGEKVSASRQFISNFENGSKKCSLDKLVQISQALGCDLDITMTPNR